MNISAIYNALSLLTATSREKEGLIYPPPLNILNQLVNKYFLLDFINYAYNGESPGFSPLRRCVPTARLGAAERPIAATHSQPIKDTNKALFHLNK